MTPKKAAALFVVLLVLFFLYQTDRLQPIVSTVRTTFDDIFEPVPPPEPVINGRKPGGGIVDPEDRLKNRKPDVNEDDVPNSTRAFKDINRKYDQVDGIK